MVRTRCFHYRGPGFWVQILVRELRFHKPRSQKKKKKRKVSYLLKHIVSVNTVIWREGKGTKRKEKGSILLSIIMANMIACKISINKTRQREMLINFIKRPGGLVLYPRSARLALA